ncbi:MAG: hypothetical protein D6722_04560 [Bacteroidetes bacterium]|nr:MAG: hypothetical protein D6722_04560 [Bacteroidota bacterium]
MVLKTLVLLVLGIAGVFLAARLFPLPKGQGLAYVAHPFLALMGGVVTGIVYLIVGLAKVKAENQVFWGGLLASLAWSLAVFSLLV